MQSINKQRGLTLISWMFLALFLGFYLLLAVKLAPVYIESLTVNSLIRAMVKEDNIFDLPKSSIREQFNKRLYVNGIERVTAKDLEIEKTGKNMTFTISYETRTKIIANADAVLHFEKSYEAVKN